MSSKSHHVLVTLILVSYGLPEAKAGTPLSDLAAQMQPGTWAELQTTGLNSALLDAGGGHHILEYADKAAWDSWRKEFHFVGQGHYAARKHIAYTENNNTWQVLTPPPVPAGKIGHGYRHNSINVEGRQFYYRQYNSGDIYVYDLDRQSWTGTLPANPFRGSSINGGVEYFPELGGIIWAQVSDVSFYNETTQSWSVVANGIISGGYLAHYSAVNESTLVGGEFNIFKIDRLGGVTRLKSSPISLDYSNGPNAVVTVDPVSGNFLAVGRSAFYEFDMAADEWRRLDFSGVPIAGKITGCVAAPIDNYGVVMFLSKPLGPKVYLYKHSPSQAPPEDTTAPAAPDNLRVE